MRVKFLNLNIWKGKLLSKAASFIAEEDPDILALQEVFNGSAPNLPSQLRLYTFLREKLGYPYAYFSAECLYDLPEGKIEHGNAIYSKFPIGEKLTVFYDVPFSKHYVDQPGNYEFHPRNLQHAAILVNSARVNIFNTHGIYGLDGRDNPRRLRMSQTIIKALKDKENVILSGDFNLHADTKTIRRIEKYVTNVFQDSLVTSFNIKRKENPDYGRVVVDMIFVGKDVGVLERYCPKVDVSDHLPLVCILQF